MLYFDGHLNIYCQPIFDVQFETGLSTMFRELHAQFWSERNACDQRSKLRLATIFGEFLRSKDPLQIAHVSK